MLIDLISVIIIYLEHRYNAFKAAIEWIIPFTQPNWQ